MNVVVLLEKFCLEFGNIHIRGTFRFASFAAQAKIHHFINLLVIEAVEFLRIREKFTQDIGPGTRRVFFIFCGHIRGAHRTPGQLRFPAVACSVALFSVL